MRHNFSAATKKAALSRSGGRCEAVGVVYGLRPTERCKRLLEASGVEYDHWPLPAHAEDSARLDNCMAVCPICHKFKTRTWDIPAEAKIKRILRKAGPPELRRKTKKIQSPGFRKDGPKVKMQSRGFEKRMKT